jgi:Cys-tRNA(Pro)/Cys-tRNA(Cys) deacylase
VSASVCSAKISKTNAARLLDSKGLVYRLLSFTPPKDDLSAQTAAALLNIEEETVYKTLILKGDQTGLLAACIPSSSEVNLKALSAALSNNRSVALVATKELFALTGYRRGGCSPLGLKKPCPIFFHSQVLKLENVAVNAGSIGLMLFLNPNDLIKAISAVTADITV